jgi:hypothetical protein
LAHRDALVRRSAADPCLDGIDLADPAQRLGRDRVLGSLMHVEKLSSRMRQAVGERNRPAGTVWPGKAVIPGVAIDLQLDRVLRHG